ncbi:MAG: UvrD-helicase domain-containing protein [Caldimicrobium sp.]|nr:UvrD-helicase domain-containing protein [Caldimicrobium sp.]MCX7613000.1 UvrD-helicase domain-containing protein [Caldimicrobium sp.]MDW8182297.1 UvrD-helicase domain-containing protein [Caldimicrobium sp.]
MDLFYELMDAPVIIYQASAGSGKTYQIALTYLTLLKKNINKEIPFKDLLAITFTNEAAYEMKERIIRFLKEIVLKTEEGKTLSEMTTLAPEEASYLIDNLFLNYDYLDVRTIDSFLLKLFRGLAYEMNLYPRFSVVKYVDDSYLEKALMYLYEEALVKENLLAFFESFVDFILTHESRVQLNLKKRILRELKEFIKVSTYKEEFLRGATSLQDVENNKDSSTTNRRAFFSLKLWSLLKEKLERVFLEEGQIYMGIWKEKLAQTLRKEELPWVYVKLGMLSGFIIDEFQDTDRLHWLTIYPLVEDMISQGKVFVAAGDPKQSIYRWKGGDPTLMTTLREKLAIHRPVEKPLNINYRSCASIVNFNNAFFEALKGDDIKDSFLKRTLFGKDPKSLEEDLLNEAKSELDNLFSQITQEPKKNIDGRVYIDWIACQEKDTTSSIRKLLWDRIREILCELRDKGELADTAILLRRNEDIIELSGFLLNHDFKVLGSSFLKIKGSPLITALIAFMKLFYDEDDEMALATVLKGLYGNKGHKVLSNYMNFKNLQKGAFDLKKYLKDYEGEIWQDIERLVLKASYLNLYQFMRMLIDHFKLEETHPEERIYIYKFLSIILSLTFQGLDGEEFLKNWESHLEEEVDLPEDEAMIKILTIHKAKGLEFRNVIFPLDMHYQPMRPTLGLVFTENAIHRGKKEDIPREFLKFYYAERISSSLEMLNLFYVAFTRAIKNLYILVPVKPKDNFLAAELFIRTFEKIGEEVKNKWCFLR